MEREIKFRGKRLDTGDWAYGYYDKTQSGSAFINGRSEKVRNDGFAGFRYPVYPESVGQFIGVQDNNGIDLYEGDIIGKVMDDIDGEFTIQYVEGIPCAISLQDYRFVRPINISKKCGCNWIDVTETHSYDFTLKGNVHDEGISEYVKRLVEMVESDICECTPPKQLMWEDSYCKLCHRPVEKSDE